MSTSTKPNGPTIRPPGDEEDRCPHCSSTRYMNKNLTLLTNSICYHRLCETCVDRLFGQGPRACPYAGCGKTIRRLQYRKPTFEDLKIEREVDIRRYVATVFNRRQEEFIDLRKWNDYLELVEELTFNLIYGIDVKETEAKIESYRTQNRESIKRNRLLNDQERAALREDLKQERLQRRLGGVETDREEEAIWREREELEAQQWGSRRTGDSKVAASSSKNVARKKAANSSKEMAAAAAASADNGGPIFEIQGLKPVEAPKAKEAFDPFGGYVIKTEYYQLQKNYQHSWLDRARKDVATTAGGYDVGEYCARAMMEAFSGLGVFVGEEVE